MRNLRPFLILTLFLSAVVLPGGLLLAESKHATKEEAQAMATKAADFLQKEGPDKAFAAFNAGGDWRDGDLYVFVIDKTGTWRSHGARPEVIGTKADLDKRVIKEISRSIRMAGSITSLRAQQTTRCTTRVRTWCGLVTCWLELALTNIRERHNRCAASYKRTATGASRHALLDRSFQRMSAIGKVRRALIS